MKKITLLVICLFLVGVSASAQFIQDQAVQTDQNAGYMDVDGATPASFSVYLAPDTITDIGAVIPVGAKGVNIYAFNGDVIVNDNDCLATGAIFVGDKIASGSSMKFSGKKAGAFNLYGAPNGTSAATVTITLW